MRILSPTLRLLCAFALALAIFMAPHDATLTGAATPHRLTLWLDWYPNTDHAGIYVAIARGYYAQEGLSVDAKVPSGAADATRLVAHGTGEDVGREVDAEGRT